MVAEQLQLVGSGRYLVTGFDAVLESANLAEMGVPMSAAQLEGLRRADLKDPAAWSGLREVARRSAQHTVSEDIFPRIFDTHIEAA
jgi:hypothetical protein